MGGERERERRRLRKQTRSKSKRLKNGKMCMAKEKHWRQHRESNREVERGVWGKQDMEPSAGDEASSLSCWPRPLYLLSPIQLTTTKTKWGRPRRMAKIFYWLCANFDTKLKLSMRADADAGVAVDVVGDCSENIFGDCTRCKVSSWGKGVVKSRKKKKKTDEKEWPLIKALWEMEREGRERQRD